MLIGARTAAWLPYEELEYIISSASKLQYIMTDAILKNDLSWEIECAFAGDNNSGAICGGRYDSSDNNQRVVSYLANNTILLQRGNFRQTYAIAFDNNFHYYKCSKTLIVIDSNQYSGTFTASDTTSTRFPIFSHIVGTEIQPGTPIVAGKCKYVRFSGSTNDELIPVLKNGVPCMYGKTSNKYFYNQGEGTFGYKRYGQSEVQPI